MKTKMRVTLKIMALCLCLTLGGCAAEKKKTQDDITIDSSQSKDSQVTEIGAAFSEIPEEIHIEGEENPEKIAAFISLADAEAWVEGKDVEIENKFSHFTIESAHLCFRSFPSDKWLVFYVDGEKQEVYNEPVAGAEKHFLSGWSRIENPKYFKKGDYIWQMALFDKNEEDYVLEEVYTFNLLVQ